MTNGATLQGSPYRPLRDFVAFPTEALTQASVVPPEFPAGSAPARYLEGVSGLDPGVESDRRAIVGFLRAVLAEGVRLGCVPARVAELTEPLVAALEQGDPARLATAADPDSVDDELAWSPPGQAGALYSDTWLIAWSWPRSQDARLWEGTRRGAREAVRAALGSLALTAAAVLSCDEDGLLQRPRRAGAPRAASPCGAERVLAAVRHVDPRFAALADAYGRTP